MEKFFSGYPYYQVNYTTFNENSPSNERSADNLISTKDGQIMVLPMWRMEMLGKYYGICIHEYDADINWEYYDEVIWQIDSAEEREKFRSENYKPDTYDDYFERLAEVAAEVGSLRAEIKCLVKSLILKYRSNRIKNISDFPHAAFTKLYNRLISSKNIEQLRVAERLSRYHIKKLQEFLQYDIREKIVRVNWIEE